jgi:hypothetical protein
MKLSEFKIKLESIENVQFKLPNGNFVESHIHLTEIAMLSKDFIDCGGTVRSEVKVGFQLWKDDADMEHRLHSEKILQIISLSEDKLNIVDAEIEVEYQSETIGKYGLDYNGTDFVLTKTFTECLAGDKCGIPVQEVKSDLSELANNSSCSPNSGCC